MRRRAVALLMAALMTAGLAATGLTGCGDEGGGRESVRLMVWSPQGDQSKDAGEWLQTCCNAFAEEHPEYDITFVYGVADEASSAGQVSQDAEASADVFLYANDNLTTMTDADALVKFGGIYREEIEKTNSETSLASVMKDGEVYGVPFAINTWFMFYDKSVFTEEDVKNLDTMLEKGVVAFPFTNSWYLPAFYFGNGCTLFGDGTDAFKGADFGGEKAQEVTDYLIDLEANPNFRIDDLGSGLAGMRDGSINAMFSGSWDAVAVKEALGDNMGVAALPTYTLNGEEKQMYSYAGTKAVGVNAQSKNMLPAVQLAIFLGNEYSQRLHYELESVVPTHTALLDDPELLSDEVVAAINETFNNTSILQPNLAEMANCWTPVENMGKGIRNGSITHENSAEQTEMMNEMMNSDGI
ncbi:MAG TPA: extracellular solute-binding protein [Candidatus Mediterraneibacter merdipullorum]|nr:extracellular solute-binding protein [Candidatus Mediterraneibacter merdipullorum]